ncbi:MAG: porin [Azospirillaceae bacterium]
MAALLPTGHFLSCLSNDYRRIAALRMREEHGAPHAGGQTAGPAITIDLGGLKDMKKYLLAGTALAGFVAFGGQAFAQAEPVTLTLSGNVDFQMGVGTEDNEIAGGRDRDYDANTDGEIVFNFDGVADNGLGYGGEIEFDGVTSDGVGIDEIFGYISGGWGEVRLGDKEGPVANFSQAAPVAGDGIWDGGFGTYITGTTPNTGGFDADLGDVTTIHYLTPNFNGFQAGVAFAPTDTAGAGGPEDLTDSAGVGSGPANAGNPNHENYFSGAAAYGGDFGNVSLSINAGIGFAEYVANNADDDDYMNANVGVNVGFGGFTVGGSWVGVLETAGGVEDTNNFTFGVGYGMGAWNVALSGIYSMSDLEGGGENEDITFGAGADYALAEGLSVYADIVYFDADRPGGANDNDGIVGLAGVDFNF